MRGGKPTGVRDIIKRLMKTTSLGKRLDEAVIWERWGDLVGPHLAAHGRPVTVKDKTLVLEADSAVWMHRFSYRKWDIVSQVNELAGHCLLEDVFITLVSDEDPTPPQDGV